MLIAVLHTPHALAQDPNATRQAELVKLVRQDCGSCHGARLTGGLGPALTPNALMDRPREAMIATILRGRLGTPMPPWAPFLSEREAEWIFDRLLAGFPEELAHAH
ncbi:c-type cytochrome [Niveibacterium umoris]|uniref:c-type cytochrome n=1 Tax=Niveibacterium umoris TaxID=1193620 RepID=UPI0016202758